jgi:hypothetical protein
VLAAIVDALGWRHALEVSDNPNFKLTGQRIVVHPKFLTKLTEVFERQDFSMDSEGGHAIAYQKILEPAQ